MRRRRTTPHDHPVNRGQNMLLANCQVSAPLEHEGHFHLSLENQFANSISPGPTSIMGNKKFPEEVRKLEADTRDIYNVLRTKSMKKGSIRTGP
jgi:hypothetical protein